MVLSFYLNAKKTAYIFFRYNRNILWVCVERVNFPHLSKKEIHIKSTQFRYNKLKIEKNALKTIKIQILTEISINTTI